MTKVFQRHSRGCAVAAIAMITGQDYAMLVQRLFGTFGKVEERLQLDLLADRAKLESCLFDPMFGAVMWEQYDRQPYARLVCRKRDL